jgi:hypothetical protein
MQSITAVFHHGRIEIAQPVDWPDGTQVQVTPIDHPAPRTDGVSLEEFEAGLDELASASDSIPVLPPDAYTRESIYGDD